MKFLITFLMLFTVFANDLTREQASRLENEIDNICGDTWCEGDFNWSFNNFDCDFSVGHCTMDLTLIDYLYSEDNDWLKLYAQEKQKLKIYQLQKLAHVDINYDDYEANISFEKKCKMDGLTKLSDVITDDYSYYSDKVYDLVSECILEIEEEYYRLNDQAEILASIDMCTDFKVKNIQLDYTEEDYNTLYYYDEKKELDALAIYAQEKGMDGVVSTSSLTNFVTWPNLDNFNCKYALNELQADWFISAYKTNKSPWYLGESEVAFRFTHKVKYSESRSINFLLYKKEQR
jgi:hypothetical protein